MGGLEVLTGGDGEEGGLSEVIEDTVEEKKELEDDEWKDVLEEGVGLDEEKGGSYGLIGGELVSY